MIRELALKRSINELINEMERQYAEDEIDMEQENFIQKADTISFVVSFIQQNTPAFLKIFDNDTWNDDDDVEDIIYHVFKPENFEQNKRKIQNFLKKLEEEFKTFCEKKNKDINLIFDILEIKAP